VSDASASQAAGRTGDPDARADAIEREIQGFLAGRTRTVVPAGRDLFASGLVSSLFAMELILHLEETYGIELAGDDLQLGNFRTIERMTALVTRLQNLTMAAGG